MIISKKTIRLWTLLALLPFVSLIADDPSSENKPVTIRVLLAKLKEDALIEVKGRHQIYNPKTDELVSVGSKKKRSRLQAGVNGIFWGQHYPDLFEMRIIPATPDATLLVDGIQYRGCLEIYAIGGTINIVNEVSVEQYLRATLPNQSFQKLPMAALDALAIVERTNLYHTIEKDPYASWQVEASLASYQGVTSSKKTNPMSQAITRTKEMILHHKKAPFAASWSFDHAGSSVSYPTVFRKKEAAPSGVEKLPSQKDRQKSKWKSSIPLDKLASLANLSSISKVDLFCAQKSGKNYGLRLKGSSAQTEKIVDIDFFSLQRHIGALKIPSNDFKVLLKGKKAYFIGYGKGNGVGLCLKSASILAKMGKNLEEILSIHFPQTELVDIRQEMGLGLKKNLIWE